MKDLELSRLQPNNTPQLSTMCPPPQKVPFSERTQKSNKNIPLSLPLPSKENDENVNTLIKCTIKPHAGKDENTPVTKEDFVAKSARKTSLAFADCTNLI